jgi:hypothetical protein
VSAGGEPAPETVRPARSLRVVVIVLSGATIGLLLGLVLDAAAWLYAFATAFRGGARVTVPFIVTAFTSGDDVVARSGLGVLILPLAIAVLGVIVGLLLARIRRTPAR